MVVSSYPGLPEVTGLNREQVDRWIDQVEALGESGHDSVLVKFLAELYQRRSVLLQFKRDAAQKLAEQRRELERVTAEMQSERSQYESETAELETEVLRQIEFIGKVNQELMSKVCQSDAGAIGVNDDGFEFIQEIFDQTDRKIQPSIIGTAARPSRVESRAAILQQKERPIIVDLAWVSALFLGATSTLMWNASTSQPAAKNPQVYQTPQPIAVTNSPSTFQSVRVPVEILAQVSQMTETDRKTWVEFCRINSSGIGLSEAQLQVCSALTS